MCSCRLMLISSAGNKICGKIQCRAVSTFLGHLAPLFYYLCSHTILAQLFLIFFGSFLFNVMALPMFWASQCFPVFMFLYKRLYYVGAQNGIIVESWYTLALLDAFCNRKCSSKISEDLSLFWKSEGEYTFIKPFSICDPYAPTICKKRKCGTQKVLNGSFSLARHSWGSFPSGCGP